MQPRTIQGIVVNTHKNNGGISGNKVLNMYNNFSIFTAEDEAGKQIGFSFLVCCIYHLSH